MTELLTNLQNIQNIKENIKQAIINKGQPISDSDMFDTYADKITNISTGSDTGDATATADDIINPKTAYVNGQKITGNIIPVYGISSLQTLGVVYSIDAIYDSFLFDYNIAVKLTSNGLVVANISSGSIEQSKTIDASTLGIETIGTGAASFFPENVENNTIRLLIMSAPTNSGSRNYTAYVYKFNVKTFDIELLNSLEMTKIESSGRTIGRTWQEKIVWTDSSTCILPFLYADGPWYNFGGLTFRYFKLIINLDNNINLYVDKSTSLGNAFGDVTGGTLAGVNSVTKVGNYVVVFTSKNYAGNSDYNWNYSSIFIDYTTDNVSFISNGSDVGYVYHNSKVYGGNKIYNISNLQTPIGDITFNIPATKQIFIDQNYVVAYSGSSLHIYKFTDDETIEDEQSFNNFNSCNANSTFSNLYMYSSSNLQRLAVQKELNSLNKGGVFFRNSSTATATPSDVLLNKVAYGRDGEFSGTMPNNGALNFSVSTNQQLIPAGYTSGGTIEASPISKDDYSVCLRYSSNIIYGGDLSLLSYIQSSGSQYIDTGVIPTNNTIIEMSIKKVGNIVDYERLFGINNIYEIMRDNRGTTFRLRFNGGDGTSVSFNVSTTDFTKIKFGKGEFYLNDDSAKTYSYSFTTNKNAYLFYANEADRYGIIQLAYCKIWEDTELIRSFIPVKDSSDVVCLYDTIGKKFYYNEGTGNFIGGEN